MSHPKPSTSYRPIVAWSLTRDGQEICRSAHEADLIRHLHQIQPQSVHDAATFGRFRIQPIRQYPSSDLCADELEPITSPPIY